ncbi:unnamed protein product [Phytomonas sp. EM1]|nr:unnamed protein product [Phytomonas sp. EM1]|eukprot:CCW64886.1 unnamed protein product [Phytomonas sp. isolate EM1]
MVFPKGNSENEEAEYTPEQHLVAAVSEFKRLESANLEQMERLYASLQSPFKLSAKPCEEARAKVLKCYEAIINKGNANGGTPKDGKDWEMLPLHDCFPSALEYRQCVEAISLSQHAALASSWGARKFATQATESSSPGNDPVG